MNKLIALSISWVIAISTFAADDYVITINGKPHDIGLDSKTEIVLSDGQKLKVELRMKDELQCNRPYFSFIHSSRCKLSSSNVDDGISQTTLFSPNGTSIIIYEFSNVDPSFAIDRMLSDLIKEEVDYGYKCKENVISKKIGKYKVEGKQAITSYKHSTWVREVCTISGKDCGIMIATQIETVSNANDKPLIDTFWETLKISLH